MISDDSMELQYNVSVTVSAAIIRVLKEHYYDFYVYAYILALVNVYGLLARYMVHKLSASEMCYNRSLINSLKARCWRKVF
jgi:hypothetical protein